MKKSIFAFLTSILVLMSFNIHAYSQDVKVGIILGFTGPIESLTPTMASSAELAFKEATDAGILGGVTLTPIRADSTCIDAAAAVSGAERLVTSDNVAAIMGADCSGVTTAITNNVAVPNGVTIICLLYTYDAADE